MPDFSSVLGLSGFTFYPTYRYYLDGRTVWVTGRAASPLESTAGILLLLESQSGISKRIHCIFHRGKYLNVLGHTGDLQHFADFGCGTCELEVLAPIPGKHSMNNEQRPDADAGHRRGLAQVYDHVADTVAVCFICQFFEFCKISQIYAILKVKNGNRSVTLYMRDFDESHLDTPYE